MADEGIFTKNADIQARAGINANTTSKATAATDVYVLNIEGTINVMTNYNWSDAYTAGLNADVQGMLTDIGASMCAIIVILSDMSGYTSRDEAIGMVNILNNSINRGLMTLKNTDKKRFLKNA